MKTSSRRAAKRMEKANGDGGKATGCTFALLAFEAAWEPADLHALVAAIHNLREFGLFSPREDDKVEPTPAALHAVKLLT